MKQYSFSVFTPVYNRGGGTREAIQLSTKTNI